MDPCWVVTLNVVICLLSALGIWQIDDYAEAFRVLAVAGFSIGVLGIGIVTGQVEYAKVFGKRKEARMLNNLFYVLYEVELWNREKRS